MIVSNQRNVNNGTGKVAKIVAKKVEKKVATKEEKNVAKKVASSKKSSEV